MRTHRRGEGTRESMSTTDRPSPPAESEPLEIGVEQVTNGPDATPTTGRRKPRYVPPRAARLRPAELDSAGGESEVVGKQKVQGSLPGDRYVRVVRQRTSA